MASSGTAVVIGASMGGLLAARALHETYANVIVIDRDALPDAARPRKGVPQGRQLHVLLSRGVEAFDELFPGLSAELVGLGVPPVDLQHNVHWYNDGYLMRRAPSTLTALGTSRPLFEQVVRDRVAALPGVEFRAPVEVLGLIATSDGGRVTGVRVLPVGGDADGYTIGADFVVDASGRGSRSPVWLAALGYEPASEEQVRIEVTYVTRVYRREPHHIHGLQGVLANPTPHAPRAGIVAAREGGQFAVALSGVLGEEPPTDDEGMARFADTLAGPEFAEVIRSAVPVGDAHKMRYPASVRRRYDRVRRFPDGYLVVADALCSFNPIYGQGMTVAALEALLLRRLLADGRGAVARRFFRAAQKIIDIPWSIAVGTDLRFPEVVGPRSLRVRFVNAYIHRLHRAATRDTVLGEAFLRVLNLAAPPTSLLAPRIAWRVLRGGVARGDATPPYPAEPHYLTLHRPMVPPMPLADPVESHTTEPHGGATVGAS